MPRILITGASRGIGRATAVALAAQGHEVIATARDVTALADVPAALRLSLDVTDQDSAEAVLAARKAAPEDAPFVAAPLDW